MTTALTATQTEMQTWGPRQRRVPCVNLQHAARSLSRMAVPMVTVAALASLPTAHAWFGSDPQLFIACMDGCDRIPEDLTKLACYTACWLFS